MQPPFSRDIANLFVVGFEGPSVSEPLRRALEAGVLGVILFRRNIESRDQVQALCAELRRIARRPLVVAVDQEGGRVQRLKDGFTLLPSARELAQLGPEGVRAMGRRVGQELLGVGINWNFAPVLDVDTNPHNPIIGDRAFSSDAGVVAELGVAFAQGLEEVGVASSGKHFPGHGDTDLDSHLALPRLPHDLTRLREIELKPFQAYSKAGLASIMTAHVIFERLDPAVPATMSERVLGGMLRSELGFEGLIVSDDLEMKAVSEHYGVEAAAVGGLRAGVDCFLVCEHLELFERAARALALGLERGEVPRARLEDAKRRVAEFQKRWELTTQDLTTRDPATPPILPSV